MSQKSLYILCFCFLVAALAEGYLLRRDHFFRQRGPYMLDFDLSTLLRFRPKVFTPLSPLSPFPKLPKLLSSEDDKFFGSTLGDYHLTDDTFFWTEPRREDDGHHIKLVFNIKGHEEASYDVKVYNAKITLTGREDKKSQGEKTLSQQRPWQKLSLLDETLWTHTQDFPLPEDVDPINYKVERDKGTLSVVFEKRKNRNVGGCSSTSKSISNSLCGKDGSN